MVYSYKTKGTCSVQIDVELDGDIVKDVKFYGGCHGNLQAIPILVKGLTVDEVIKKLRGVNCNGRGTSCADQLTYAIEEAYKNQ